MIPGLGVFGGGGGLTGGAESGDAISGPISQSIGGITGPLERSLDWQLVALIAAAVLGFAFLVRR